MAKFLPLHTTQGNYQYINIEEIQGFVKYDDEESTEIQFADGSIFVKETPEEILELIKAAQ